MEKAEYNTESREEKSSSTGMAENVISMINSIGKKENLDNLVRETSDFFKNMHLELEDWKVSVEEFKEGTRVFARFQIIIKR